MADGLDAGPKGVIYHPSKSMTPYPLSNFSGGVSSGPTNTFHLPAPLSDDFLFTLEALVTGQEYAMLKALAENPDDLSARSMYYDYLLDVGRTDSARKVREGYTPGRGSYRGRPLSGAL